MCVFYIFTLLADQPLKSMQEFEGENSLWMVFKEAGNGNPLVVAVGTQRFHCGGPGFHPWLGN